MLELSWRCQGSMTRKESYDSKETRWSVSRWNLWFWNLVCRDCGPKSCTTYVPFFKSSCSASPLFLKTRVLVKCSEGACTVVASFSFLECWFNGPAYGLFVIRMVSCLVASLPPFPPQIIKLVVTCPSVLYHCLVHAEELIWEGEWRDAYLHNLWSRELRGRAARPWLSPWPLYEPQRMFIQIQYSSCAEQDAECIVLQLYGHGVECWGRCRCLWPFLSSNPQGCSHIPSCRWTTVRFPAVSWLLLLPHIPLSGFLFLGNLSCFE